MARNVFGLSPGRKSTIVSRNSRTPRISNRNQLAIERFSGAFLFAGLALLSAASVWFVNAQGWTLYYGDAEAHLNIARRVVDSRTPGYWQLGTVWLPLPHVLMLPFVRVDWLWRTGLGGVIPSAAAFVLAGMALFGLTRRLSGSNLPGVVAVAVFALNPNLLYLQATPMTEPVFLAGLLLWLYSLIRYSASPAILWLCASAAAANAAVLTRYEGWFLLPFSAIFIILKARHKRLQSAVLYCFLVCLGPLYWLAHNWINWGDALEFYRGPFSAGAIYQRSLDAGMQRYPGDHNWYDAQRYYLAAARLCSGTSFFFLGVIGALAALFRRWFWAVLFLALPPAFYLLSLYSAGTPIFVPHLWPNSFYNTRYGIALLPLLALGCGAAVSCLGRAPARARALISVALVGIAVAPWIVDWSTENWVCLQESRVNSAARRQWTEAAASYLKSQYGPRDGVFSSFGDLSAILRQAGVGLSDLVHDGNRPSYDAIFQRPDLYLNETWAIAMAGDPVARTLDRARSSGIRYRIMHEIPVKDAPAIQIYRRVR